MLLAPAGTAEDVVDKLHGEMEANHLSPDMKKKIDIGLIPLYIASVEQSRAYIKAEGEAGNLVRKLGLSKRRNESTTGSKSPRIRPIGTHRKHHGQAAIGPK